VFNSGTNDTTNMVVDYGGTAEGLVHDRNPSSPRKSLVICRIFHTITLSVAAVDLQ
jgi:hypothetical protein